MTSEEFENSVKVLKEKHKNEMNSLKKEYAFANNPYKIGDVISGNTGTIRIDKITVGISLDGIPLCVYHGLELKKDLTPTKKMLRTAIWQSNINKK